MAVVGANPTLQARAFPYGVFAAGISCCCCSDQTSHDVVRCSHASIVLLLHPNVADCAAGTPLFACLHLLDRSPI